MFENKDKEPAYGMLSFSRVSGGDPNLFGSSVQHNQKIRLVLKEGHVARELNNDWYGGDRTLFEVEMSYTQFAELISAMNVGDGIPVTIRYTESKGSVPGIQIVNKRKQFINEFADANANSSKQAKDLILKLKEIFESKKPIKAKERDEILSDLTQIYNAVSSHNTFMLKQFDEAMENISSEAKGEVEAFVQNKLTSIALAAMKDQDPETLITSNPLRLPETKDDPV